MLHIVIISDSLPQKEYYNVTRSLLKRFPYYPAQQRVSTATCNKKEGRTGNRYKEKKNSTKKRDEETRKNLCFRLKIKGA